MSTLFDFFSSTVVYLTSVELIKYVAVGFAIYGLVLIIASLLYRRN